MAVVCAPFLHGAQGFQTTNQKCPKFLGFCKEKVTSNQRNPNCFSLFFCLILEMLHGLVCSIKLWMHLGNLENIMHFRALPTSHVSPTMNQLFSYSLTVYMQKHVKEASLKIFHRHQVHYLFIKSRSQLKATVL